MNKIIYKLAVFAVLTSCINTTAVAATGPQRTLVGYADPLTVRPGDTVKFMVSSFKGDYTADLVQVINGDKQSRYAKMFEVKPVKAAFAGQYKGSEQPLNLGSYIHVEKTPALDKLKSFTISAWIYPTFNPVEYKEPDLDNIDPFSPPTLNIGASVKNQTIISRFDQTKQIGWALELDEKFRLRFVTGNGPGQVKSVQITEPTRDWDWTYVAASYDAAKGVVKVSLREKPFAPGDQFIARNLSADGHVDKFKHQGPLRIAAVRNGKGATNAKLEKPGHVFNGRIQDVRIVNRVLNAKEIDAMSAETAPKKLKSQLVANWDFAEDMKSSRIRDISGNKQHGIAVNIPDRAVRGRFWRGDTIKWLDDPDQYDAITFHVDDLYDAQWKSDFKYKISKELPSGIYAARLKQGEFTEYVTFFVSAPKGKPRAKLALWLSDYNYLAYSNISLGATAAKNYPGHNFNHVDTEFFKKHKEYATGGVYNQHVDGLYYSYGSRLRPDLMMKPGAIVYNFAQDTHITAFLEHEGIAYDIITEELVNKEGVDLLKQYRSVVSATHPEYVTTKIFDAIGEYTNGGGRFIYIGGNGWFWSVGTYDGLPGVIESRNFHDIAERYLANGQRGGLMVETGRTTGPIFGNEMGGMIFNGSSPYRKLDDAKDPRAAWIFKGTKEGEVFGAYGVDKVKGGAAGFEIDRFNPGNGVPRHALHLATSEKLLPTIEDVKVGTLPLTIAYHPPNGDPWAKADMVFFETPNGGAMFSTGSITWISSTLENNFKNDIATITRNVIDRFLDPKPFPKAEAISVIDVERAPANPEYEWSDQR